MAKPLPILRRSLAESWRPLVGWTIGVVAALSMYLPLWPSVGGDGQMEQMLKSLPPELIQTLGFAELTSGAGYAQGTFFGLIGFLLLVIAATSWGSAAIAGAEESGRLELALAHGVSRVQYAIESALSVLVRLVWLGAIAVMVVLALNEPSELGIEPAHLVAGAAALTGLAFLSGIERARGRRVDRSSGLRDLRGRRGGGARVRAQCDLEPARGRRLAPCHLPVRMGVPAIRRSATVRTGADSRCSGEPACCSPPSAAIALSRRNITG